MRIRQATMKDKAAIVRLCKRSVRNDYVLLFLDGFLKDGGMFIALDGKRVVGMMKYTKCIGGDGWLGAARTDPKYRRRGVASSIMEACMKHAASQGAKFVRSWTSRTNKSAMMAGQHAGFREVGAFTRVRKRVKRTDMNCKLWQERSISRIWPLIRNSKLMKDSGFYAPIPFDFVKVTRKVLSEAVSNGWIYRIDDNICFIDEDAWGDEWKDVLEFTPLTGDVKLLLREGLLFTQDKGKKELHIFLPFNSPSLRTAIRMGFKVVSWGREAVLFEKAVKLT